MSDGTDTVDFKLEKRKPARRRSYLAGRIYNRKGSVSFDCAIRDFSDEGARIKVAREQIVPEQCLLVKVRNETVYEAKVVWRRMPEYGLKFVQTHMSDDIPLHFQFVKKTPARY